MYRIFYRKNIIDSPNYKYFDNRIDAIKFLNSIKKQKYGSYELSVRDWSPESRDHEFGKVLEIKKFPLNRK